jgi:hypothetical protein
MEEKRRSPTGSHRGFHVAGWGLALTCNGQMRLRFSSLGEIGAGQRVSSKNGLISSATAVAVARALKEGISM